MGMRTTASFATGRHPRRTSAALLLVAVALLQAAWICSVPPFRAVDEFDHAYRAASVAGGEWGMATEPAEHGRGRLLTVPADLVAAAHDTCEFYGYTGPDNCNPVTEVGRGRVRVASSAIGQTPLIYAAIGYPAAPFTGDSALYVMRAVVAGLDLLLLALSLWALGLWARSVWPYLALISALTPMVVFTSIIPAGNGPEIMAGVLLWCALMGLARVQEPGVQRKLLLVSLLPVALLSVLRQAGPAMLVVIVLLAACLLGRAQLRELWRRHRLLIVIGTALSVVLAGFQMWWTMAVSRYPVGPVDAGSGSAAPVDGLTANPVVMPIIWWVQAIGVFPTRTEPAPAAAYAIMTLVGLGLWGLALLRSRSLRLPLLLTTLATVVFPYAFSLWLWDLPQWQGRYGLPLGVGCLLLAGLALDGVPPRRFRTTVISAPVLIGVFLTQAICVLGVRPRVSHEAPLVLVLSLVAVACLAMVVGVRRLPVRPGQSPDESRSFA